MKYINSQKKWEKLLKAFAKEDTNKGIQFEDLIEMILCRLFPEKRLKFSPTKKSHDGSKDFWALDGNHDLWWAECKNSAPNLSLKIISPTLFMAELYDIDYLMIFSYSRLNSNLLRKIGIYSNRHGKRTFIYDDEHLEKLIIQYYPDQVRSVTGDIPDLEEGELYTNSFSEKNPKLFKIDNFDGFYNIKNSKLTVGEIYNLNCLVINRKNEKAAVTSNLVGRDLKCYKIYGMTHIQKELESNELFMFSVKVNLMTWKNKIKLPTIKIRDQSGKVCNVPVENSYECLAGHDGQLVGEFFENIVSEIDATIQNNHFSGILVYGNGGCGKTRILYESSRNLIARDYKVLDFTGFDNGNNWINVIREIIFCVFSVSGDMVLEMISSIEAELPLECSKQSNENISVYKLLSALKNKDVNALEGLYNIIFEKIRNNRYALIIDNFQSYSPELVDFFNRMISYYLDCGRSVNIALLFSVNVKLIYDSSFSEFICRFLSLSGKNLSSKFYCAEISGFENVDQAMVFLGNRLKLSEFPQHSQVKSILNSKRLLNPKHLDQIANHLITQGCVIIKDDKGFISDNSKFIKCLDLVPPEYQTLFQLNYTTFLEKNRERQEDFKLIFSVIYLFERIENKHIDIFHLNADSIKLLCSHGYLVNMGQSQDPSYSVEHDLSFQCLEKDIYNDLLITVSSKIVELKQINSRALRLAECYKSLCILSGTKKLSLSKLLKINAYDIDNLQNRHKLPFASQLLEKSLIYIDDKPVQMLRNINIICNYVNDHIGVQAAEKYYDKAHDTIKSLKETTPEMLEELFSFYIHDAENKIHLSMSNKVLELYSEFENIMGSISTSYKEMRQKLSYARAYILNRRFVCGKLENDPGKRIKMLESSKKICEEYGFWDIQFENFFDESNLYFSDPDKRQPLINALQNGFNAFKKTSSSQKKKYMPNFISKKLLYLCIVQDFEKGLKVSESAIEYIRKNKDINYHIFFIKRYMKYQFICLTALGKSDKTAETLRQLSVIDDLSGNADKFELLYYYFVFSYCQKSKSNAKSYFEELYSYASAKSYNYKYMCILTDCAIKLRSLLNDRELKLDLKGDSYPSVDKVLSADKSGLDEAIKSFRTIAAISTSDSINFYY